MSNGKDMVTSSPLNANSDLAGHESDKNRHACTNLYSALWHLENPHLFILIPDLLNLSFAGYPLLGIGLAAMHLQDFSSRLTAMGVRYDAGSTDCRRGLRLACDRNGHDGTWYLVDVR